MRWSWIALGTLSLASLGMFGCVNTLLPAIPNQIIGPVPSPPVLGAFEGAAPVETAEEWRANRTPALRKALETYVYGTMPNTQPAQVAAHEVIAESAFNGLGRVEEVTLALGPSPQDRMNLALAIPANSDAPTPVVLMQTFCGNAAAFNDLDGLAPPLGPYPPPCDAAWAQPLITFVFGRYNAGPPFEWLLERGYAVGIMYPGDVAPDVSSEGLAALERLAAPEGPRWGAIAAWAWAYSRAVDYVDSDARFDSSRVAVWGHSRNGKSALVAAAWDPRIDAVIAHQSGTGGATLSRSYAGESVAEITEAYPHWFTPAYADYAERETALPVDQHQLLALIAPRPVLLGNSRRDAWSDPEGAFRAAQSADEVYELLGSEGLDQSSMTQANTAADLAYFLRPGRHGVTTEDWRYFLAFLDAHFGAPDS